VTVQSLRDRLADATGGRYVVEEELGHGGMAVVYAATDVRLKRAVAIKVLPPELAFRADVRSRFQREAEMAAGLSHPHIVPIYAVEESDGLVWMVMGRVRGDSVAVRLARDGRLPIPDVRRILRETADALAHAHSHGVIHRDIKPDNILLDGTYGRVLVTDFGIARAMEGDARLTATGVAVGTPTYMSPEQARGDDDVDGRADVYALGVVGYQLLAGEPPFTAPNTPALQLKHVSEPPPPLALRCPDVPAALAYAIDRALAKDRSERWPSASAMRDALADDAAAPASYRHNVGEWAVARAPAGRAVSDQSPYAAPRALPPFPVWRGGGPGESERWRAEQQAWRERVRSQEAWADDLRARREEARVRRRGGKRDKDSSIVDRLRSFQRHFYSSVLVMLALFVINLVTSGGFPWFVFPWIGISIGICVHALTLWHDGVRLRDLLRQPTTVVARHVGPPGSAAALPNPDSRAKELAGVDVLAGPHGRAVRAAIEDEVAVREILSSLKPPDRAQLPDVEPTLRALVERVAALAQALHRLDADVQPGQLSTLESRIAQVRSLPEGAPDRERRLTLLERQRTTLGELSERRTTLSGQLENASLVLHTMRLDLLRLRSAGIASAAADVHSVTQEARALSLDIGRVLEAAAEVRKLE
jgi:serine/threonine-protein kinase